MVLLPVAAVIGAIGYLMYKSSLKRKDVSLAGHIFSWLIFIFYGLNICGALVFAAIGKKLWCLICFCVVAGTLLCLIAGYFISSAVKKRLLKTRATKLVSAKLIGAVEKKSTSSSGNGIVTSVKHYYSLMFEYQEEGEKKICTTAQLYEMPEIAYLNKNFKVFNINVYKKICLLDIDVSMADRTYSSGDIDNLEISSITPSGTDQNYMEVFLTLSFIVPVFIVGILMGISCLEASLWGAIISMVCGALVLLVPTIVVAVGCSRKIAVAKKGRENYALNFKVDSTLRADRGTRYYVNYTFEVEDGIKNKRESITEDCYGKIKILDKLPIKVYHNKAIVDLDRIV